MNIYLIRHGKAEPTSPLKKDIERALTDEGSEIIEVFIGMWKYFIKNFDVIATSPYKRAIQTAEIIANAFSYQDEIIKDNSLLPGSNINSIINLAKTLDGEDMALIGHQPDLGHHISKLVSGSDVNLKLSPASIAKISFESKIKPGKGVLEFLLQPFSQKS